MLFSFSILPCSLKCLVPSSVETGESRARVSNCSRPPQNHLFAQPDKGRTVDMLCLTTSDWGQLSCCARELTAKSTSNSHVRTSKLANLPVTSRGSTETIVSALTPLSERSHTACARRQFRSRLTGIVVGDDECGFQPFLQISSLAALSVVTVHRHTDQSSNGQ